MDNPWCIVDVGSIVQWDFDLVQCRPWEARGRDDILVPSDFLDDCIDEGRFPYVGHTHHIDVTALTVLLDLFHQVLDRTLILRQR